VLGHSKPKKQETNRKKQQENDTVEEHAFYNEKSF
jgi:hypothetical protein